MTTKSPTMEITFTPWNGWTIVVALIVYFAAIAVAIVTAVGGEVVSDARIGWTIGLGAAAVVFGLVMFPGFFLVNPNTSRVLVLFGKYRGTVRTDGFHWTHPFTLKEHVSLKAHNIASQKIKVNDLSGNPIEIGAVVVWLVRDTAQAEFDVEDYHKYTDLQVETAVRQLAKSHPYDETPETTIPSLRGDTDEVTLELQVELQKRLDRAGIEVLEARISHLAYAPEIASAMLQRQQANAVVAARERIVEGAVSMVQQALHELSAKGIVELDPERRATMVGNLLVVLCGQAPATPVINTGTLYT